MDSAAKNRLIARISWGYISATVETQDSEIISLLLRPPTPKEQAQAALIYSTERQRAAILQLSSEREMLENFIAIGQWSLDTENEISGLQDDIHKIRKGLLDLLFNRTKLENARSLLRRAEKALMERLSNRHKLLQNSAESHAEICQQRFLVGRITEDEDGKRYWRTSEDFNDCQDGELIAQLCEQFFSRSRVPISTIRKLARSQEWRSFWEISKNTNDLFDGPVASWSLNQRELAYWSTIYDSVYGAMERPDKDVIDDDDLLDSWFIRQGEKIEGKNKKPNVKMPNKPGKNESFVMSDREGAKRVYNMNDPSARVQLKARQKVLQAKGSVKEQDMPDSQRDMRQQLTQMQRKHVKDISSR